MKLQITQETKRNCN